MNTHVESPASENRENLEEMRGSVGGGSRESKHVPLRDGHIYWRRIVAEALAIVASILLAFAIDTWWERRGLAREETVVLQGLLADFQSTAARAAAVRANSQDML